MADLFPRLPSALERHGPWRSLEPLAGDASARRYARLRGPGSRTVIAVVYPRGGSALLGRDLEVRGWLEARGLRVPRLCAAAVADGWALLEDFGPVDAAGALADMPPESRVPAMERLIAPLAVLAALEPSNLPPWTPPLDRARMRWELAGFELWYLRARCGTVPPAGIGSWLDHLAEECASVPLRVCHRDFHLNNLYLLDDGSVGVIDFQDLLVGPEPYDVVSLVGERAAPSLLTPAQRRAVLQVWADTTRAGADWEQRAVAVEVQRSLKVLGTFSRLELAGRAGYSQWLRALEGPAAEAAGALGAPQELTDLLLHSEGQGGPHVR